MPETRFIPDETRVVRYSELREAVTRMTAHEVAVWAGVTDAAVTKHLNRMGLVYSKRAGWQPRTEERS